MVCPYEGPARKWHNEWLQQKLRMDAVLLMIQKYMILFM
jgi:hypothetical protein